MATAATISTALTLSSTAFHTGLAGAVVAAKAFSSTTSTAFQQLGNLGSTIASGIGNAFVMGAQVAGVALLGLGGALAGLATGTFLAFARVKELQFVNEQLALTNGYAVDAVKAEAKEVADLGIEAAVAEKTVAELMKINLDMSKASDIARIAQNAAVISGKNSTEVTDKIIHGITTLNPLVLRHAGIIVDLQAAYKEYAKEAGKSTLELTTLEKQNIALNEVMEAGTRLEGLYEKSMTSASKQLRSFPRYFNEVAVAIGGHFDEAFEGAIFKLADFVKGFRDSVEEGGALYPVFKRLGDIFKALFGGAGDVSDRFDFEALGEKLYPVVDKIAGVVEDVMPLVRDFFDIFDQPTVTTKSAALYDWLFKVARLFGMGRDEAWQWADTVRDNFWRLLGIVKTVFAQVTTFFEENKGVIVGIVAVIVAAFGAWAIAAISAALSTIAAFLPVILAIAAIGVAAWFLYTMWTENWWGIQEIVQQAVLKIKSFLLGMHMFIEALTSGKLGVWSDIWRRTIFNIKTIWFTFTENLKDGLALLRAAFEGDWYKFGEILRQIWDRTWMAVKTLFLNNWATILDLLPMLWGRFKKKWSDIDWASLGTNILKGIKAGMLGFLPNLLSAAIEIGNNVADVFRGFFRIHSPSALMAKEVGMPIAEGIMVGYRDGLALSPALAAGQAMNTSGSRSEDNALLEEVKVLLRNLPNDLKRANRDLLEKTGRNR